MTQSRVIVTARAIAPSPGITTNGRRELGLRSCARMRIRLGEADHWQLELRLNELGKAFLVIDQFATLGPPQLTQ